MYQTGVSLDLSGDGLTLAIGSPYNNGNGKDSGSVSVYRRYNRDSGWKKLGQTILGDVAFDRGGTSVSLSENGNTLAIGATQFDSPGKRGTGQVKILDFDDSEEIWILSQAISGEVEWDQIGTCVSLSQDGNKVAFGAQWSSRHGSSSGLVRVFQRTDSTWDGLGQAAIYGDVAGDMLGHAVALSGNGMTLAAGAPGHRENSGYVVIYGWDSNSNIWKQKGLLGDVTKGRAGFAVDLSRDGSVLAIGVPDAAGINGDSSGQVKVYEYDDDSSSWKQRGQDLDSVVESVSAGWSVSISADGNTLVVGATGYGEQPGHATIYVWDDATSNYVKLAEDIAGDAPGDGLGFSVALSSDGKIVAVGAERHNGPKGVDSGQVKAFSI